MDKWYKRFIYFPDKHLLINKVNFEQDVGRGNLESLFNKSWKIFGVAEIRHKTGE